MKQTRGSVLVKKLIERLRSEASWRFWTEGRRLSELAEALEERRPGLLPPYPTARIAYLRKAMQVFPG
jgi:hypothetical protein